ncbi:hypothetical protein Hanom_Chr16g01423971 [Helianthus anomalus]
MFRSFVHVHIFCSSSLVKLTRCRPISFGPKPSTNGITASEVKLLNAFYPSSRVNADHPSTKCILPTTLVTPRIRCNLKKQ